MRYGIVLPFTGGRLTAELAALAEHSGWDGIFVAETVWGLDAWGLLTAAAARTERIRLGTMLTPLPRRRPWDLAGQTATLDDFSGGRVILSVGLGALHPGWTAFERDQGRRTRAELLDEGLDVLTGLWRGQPFSYQGQHYTVTATDFFAPPPPVQQPRITTWVVGACGRPRSMARVARYDGWIPNAAPPGETEGRLTPEMLRDGVALLAERRAAEGIPDQPFDVVTEGTTPADRPDEAAAEVKSWADAGATWWIESDWGIPAERLAETLTARIEAGPPRVD